MPATGARVELLIGGLWTDITSDVYLRDRIKIVRGRQDQGARVDPGSCSFTLKAKSGRYQPRNPLSDLFGKIGRNTRVRVSTAAGSPWLGLTDDTVPDVRVSTPTATALNVAGDLDVRFDVQPDDWSSTGTVELGGKRGGTGQFGWQCIIFSGIFLLNWSTNGTVEQFASFRVNLGPVTPRMVLRATLDINNGASGQTATLYSGPTIDGPWTQLGSFVSPNTPASIFANTAPLQFGDVASQGFANAPARLYRAQLRNGINGTVVSDLDFTTQQPGALTMTDAQSRTWTASSNTAITNRRTRFMGEIPSWPARRALEDVYVPVQAAGILRRLGKRSTVLDSTLRRRIPTDPALIGYWPMEDNQGARQAYSPVQGVRSMQTAGLTFGADDSLPGSRALPSLGPSASILATVPPATANTEWRVEFVYRIDTAPGSSVPLVTFGSTGTIRTWTISYAAGVVTVAGFNSSDTQVVNSTVGVGSDIYGQWVRQVFVVRQAAGVVTWTIQWVRIGELSGGQISGTVNPGAAGACNRVSMTTGAALQGARIGHIAVFQVADTVIFNRADSGFDGEAATDRATRLCGEESIPLRAPYGTAGSALMGPQQPGTVLSLLADAGDADIGLLHESRDALALAYRPRVSLYNQPTRLALSYTTRGEVAPPLEPDPDDNGVQNDVTASRPGGSSAREVAPTGALSVLDPPDGIGTYPATPSVNVSSDDQLSNIAGWLVHLGTWDEDRFPVVTVNLTAGPWLIDQATAVDAGDRMTIADAPTWLAAGLIDLMAQGYSEDIAEFDWQIAFNCTPYGPWNVAVLDDAVLGRLDTDGSVLSAAVDADDTALPVAVTQGPAWTLDPADCPFDVVCGGEVMTVTGIGGSVVDAFGRTVASGWGSTDTGQAWTTSGGAGADYSVSGGSGRHLLSTVATNRWTLLPATVADFDLTVTVSTTALAVGASQFVNLGARFADTNNCYLARLEFTTTATVALTIRRRLAGVETQLSGGTIGSLTHTANGKFNLRFRGRGSSMWAKVWTGGSEPASWTVAAIDTALTAAGSIGLRSILNTGNTNTSPSAAWDDLRSVQPALMTVTRAVNGIVKAQSANADVRLATPSILAL